MLIVLQRVLKASVNIDNSIYSSIEKGFVALVGFQPDDNENDLSLYGTMTNETLMAVPLFIFMGITLEKAKIAEDLLETMSALFGSYRGGLAISVILVGMLLAASTGIVGATVVTMGLLSLPSMMKRDYSPSLSTGVIAASGTLGQIIPPSIVLVLLGLILQRVKSKWLG